MKSINDILSEVPVVNTSGDINTTITDVCFDSRKVKKGSMFVAVRGTQVDGHNYIQSAIEKGALAIVCEEIPNTNRSNVVVIKVDDASIALSRIASSFYNHPSSKLKLVGVTGTNGKTTTASLLHDLFINLGYKVGLLSTVKNLIHEKEIKATHTTPDPVQINNLLDQMVNSGCDYCFMEVSSHSIHQNRINGLNFKGGIFTNLTHDHLDYHKTFEEYLKVKKSFFDSLPKEAFSIVNKDDKNGIVMLQNTKSIKKTYALKSLADFKGKVLESHFDGMLMNIDGTEVWSQFVGRFNAYNILAVLSTAILLDQDKNEVFTCISKLKPVCGRFEWVKSDNGIIAIIDYAHTPDALLNVLQTISELRKANEKIITLVGAGGDRDKTKRSEMARVAVENSNKVILTSDNPRFEDPEEIINDMKKGVDISAATNVVSITNRKEAIKTASLLANEGDIILLAGKGHETYQDIKGEKIPFDDKEIIKEILSIK